MSRRRRWFRFALPTVGIAIWLVLVVRWLRAPSTITPSTILLGVIAAFFALAGLLLTDSRRN